MNTDNKTRLIEETSAAILEYVKEDQTEGDGVLFEYLGEEFLNVGPAGGTDRDVILDAHRRSLAKTVADRIEAAGPLAGSVGFGEPSAWMWQGIHGPLCSVNNPFKDDSPEFQRKHGVIALYCKSDLTRSPEPKGRWISEELYGDLVKALGKKHDGLFARIINSPYGGRSEPGITAEALAKIEASMELMGNILDGRDMVDDEAELKIINDGFAALRTAPRAKEE